ncbi:MAG: hypothetical protein AAFU79_01725 [Myxococcota bacterium]
MNVRVSPVLLVGGFLCACPASESNTPSSSAPPQAAAPASAPASAPGPAHPPVPSGEPLTGTVKLAEGLSADAVKATDTLYIMARQSQGGGLAGRLVAVKRMTGLEGKSFPARFEIGPKDTMMAGVPFAGPFIVYARLDRDGDPMTKTEEDLYATIVTPVNPGATDLELELKAGMPKTVDAPPPGAAPSSAPASQPK